MATRHERVVLELEDLFSSGMARAAASTALLKHELNSLSGQSVQTARGTRDVDTSVASMGRSADGGGKSIDRLSGRLGILVDVVAMLGPSLVPIAAVGIPAITGLASEAGFAGLAVTTLVIGLHGLGDALKAVEKARLDPTTANLEAASRAMEKLSPAAREFVGYLQTLTDEWGQLRTAAGDGFLTGAQSAIDSLMKRLPEVTRIFDVVSTTLGRIAAEGAASLASSKWDDFFRFLEVEAGPVLSQTGAAIGSVAHAMAEMWIAFDPLNTDFLGWLVTATAQLDVWATGLSKTEGFTEFIDYIEANGAQVGDTLGAIAMALIQILEAAAPVGAISLPIMEAIAKIVGTIAGSDLGTPLVAGIALMSAFSRATALWEGASKKASTTFVGGQVAALRALKATVAGQEQQIMSTGKMVGKFATSGAILAGFALQATGVTDKVGLQNAALGATAGLLAGGPWGAAIGGAIGLAFDFAKSQDVATVSATDLAAAIDVQTGAIGHQAYIDVADSLSQYADTADAAGISLGDLTAASIEGGDALAAVQTKLDVYIASLGPISGGNYDAAAAAGELEGALSGQNDEVNTAVDLAHARKAGIDAAAQADQAGADSADHYTSAIDKMAEALKTVNDLLTSRGTTRAYEAAIDDLTASVKKNGQAWSVTGEKGRTNLASLDGVVDAAIKKVDDLKSHGKDLAAQKFLTRAISDLRQFAHDNPGAAASIQPLIDKLVEANKRDVKPKVDVDSTSALRKLGVVQQTLSNLDGTHAQTYIDVYTIKHDPSGGGQTPTSGRTTAGGKYGRTFDPNGYHFSGRGTGTSSGVGEPPTLPGDPGGGGPYTPPPTIPVPFAGDDALRKAIRDILSAFSVDASQGSGAIRDQLRGFKNSVLDAGIGWTNAMELQSRNIRNLSAVYDEQTKAAEDSAKALETITATSDSFASSVAGSFNTNVLGGNLSQLGTGLSGDVANIGAMQQVLAALQGQGLDTTGAQGALYQGLAQSGNLSLAQQLLASGAGGIDYYEKLYAQRAADQQGFGSAEAAASFGQAVRDAATTAATDAATALATSQQIATDVQALRDDLKGDAAEQIGKRTGHYVGREINGAVGIGVKTPKGPR